MFPLVLTDKLPADVLASLIGSVYAEANGNFALSRELGVRGIQVRHQAGIGFVVEAIREAAPAPPPAPEIAGPTLEVAPDG